MHRFTLQSLIALNLVATLTAVMAATPAVGIATANGTFQINSAKVAGNATLFEGNTIETGKSTSQLRLNGGAQTLLAVESKGIVYRDRLVLERGENQGTLPVEARSLRIAPGNGSVARVSLKGEQVHVAALYGPVRVAHSSGVIVANVVAGNSLMFTPQGAGAAAPSTVTGCLASSNDKFWLTDETTSVKFEVSGAGVEKQVGNRVELSGTVNPSSPESNILKVTSVRKLYGKCSSKAAKTGAAGAAGGAAGAGGGAAAGAAGAAGAGAGAGVSTAVVAGVVVAGAAAGTAIAVVQATDDEQPISPSTR